MLLCACKCLGSHRCDWGARDIEKTEDGKNLFETYRKTRRQTRLGSFSAKKNALYPFSWRLSHSDKTDIL